VRPPTSTATETLLDALISVAADVRKVAGLRAVGAGSDDSVTLRDAAQRLGAHPGW